MPLLDYAGPALVLAMLATYVFAIVRYVSRNPGGVE